MAGLPTCGAGPLFAFLDLGIRMHILFVTKSPTSIVGMPTFVQLNFQGGRPEFRKVRNCRRADISVRILLH